MITKAVSTLVSVAVAVATVVSLHIDRGQCVAGVATSVVSSRSICTKSVAAAAATESAILLEEYSTSLIVAIFSIFNSYLMVIRQKKHTHTNETPVHYEMTARTTVGSIEAYITIH